MSKPNVEKIVINWLEGIIGAGWTVFGDKPKSTPEAYILVDRTGGPRESMVLDQAEILIEIYHKDSRVKASEMASIIADQIPDLKGVESITRAAVNSVVHLDDTIGVYRRYQVYCDIFSRR